MSEKKLLLVSDEDSCFMDSSQFLRTMDMYEYGSVDVSVAAARVMEPNDLKKYNLICLFSIPESATTINDMAGFIKDFRQKAPGTQVVFDTAAFNDMGLKEKELKLMLNDAGVTLVNFFAIGYEGLDKAVNEIMEGIGRRS